VLPHLIRIMPRIGDRKEFKMMSKVSEGVSKILKINSTVNDKDER
jgi:hypothetical protein